MADQEQRAPSRVNRTRRQARANYDRLSRWYGWLAGSEEPFRRRTAAMLQAQPVEKVLEIGFGTGTALVDLASTGASVAGIDLSFGMASVARSRLRKQEDRGNAMLCQGDAAVLPFANQSFDALLMTFTLELFDTQEIAIVLEQCRRVLRPGGRLAAASLALPGNQLWTVQIYEWFHRKFPAEVDCRPIPLSSILETNCFLVRETHLGAMWGLPVETVLALYPGS